jgi:hypothetical protein
MNYAERTYTSIANKRGEVLRIGEAVPPRPQRIDGTEAVRVQSALLAKPRPSVIEVLMAYLAKGRRP